jgi:anaerobic magnesium-protoporphyrin IX monomethyl ester cyclase
MKNNFRILLVYPNIPMMLVTPLSIATFTWILRQEGFDVDMFDGTQYGDDDELSSPQNRVKYLQARNMFSEANLKLLKSTNMIDDFQEKIESFGPDLILYSFTEDAFVRALKLLRVSNRYKIPTVVGGILASSDPEWVLSFPEVNMLCKGEGEEVVKEIALRMFKKQDISNVQNLWIKQPDGTIIRNPMRPYVNLDSYLSDFSLFNKDRFVRPMGGEIHCALPIETYRGCPNRCSFCNSPMHNRIAGEHKRVYLRRNSVDGIRRKIEHLLNNYDVNLLYFIDDSFLQRPVREIDAFVEMYKDFRVPFWFNTRPESCKLDILEKMKDVGLFRVSFGIESGNEEFRIGRLHRRATNEKILRSFNVIYQAEIEYSINCIIGFPFETRQMVFDTIRFVKQIRGYDSITVSTYVPYRGSKLREDAINAGWLDPDAFTLHTTSSSMLKMPHFSSRQIEGLMQTFPLYVEFDESDWPEIEKAERFEPEGEEILARYSKIYRERVFCKNDKK